MGIGVLIIGKSGSGKSASLRNFQKEDIGIINVISKPLPFENKNGLKTVDTDNYADVYALLEKSKAKSIVIDDAGYLISNQFMRQHSNVGGGNAVYNLYNDIADNYWQITQKIKGLPPDKIVYVMMHIERNEFGDIKPKTIGKLLDDKVCIERNVLDCIKVKKSR